MRRLLVAAALVCAAIGVVVVSAAASSGPGAAGTYRIEFDNAFGLVTGADFKVAGVPAGTIKSISLDQRTLHAVVTVQVTQNGFGQFHSDAFCQSRPQSLIGEYFIDCQPGQSGAVLRPGSTIPVGNTQSTIPADLLLDVMRLPYRQRFALIINELGAGVAARSDDLQAALRRAVPALTETDNLLALLANDSRTLQQLTANSNTVVTALANNRSQVQRFIVEAGKAATATASQQTSLQATLQELPGFLAQLRPGLAQLGAAAQANLPVVQNLQASASQLGVLFNNLPPFAAAALPAIRSLGQASVTGKAAVQAATPTVAQLNALAQPTPELAQNLAIVLHDLDDRSRAVEPDSRSPGGKGYTGLEALLQYVFNQTLAINTFGPFGHLLNVNAFVDPRCSPYATPATIALSLKQFGPSYRQCYAWLGPSQPAVNETDPTNPKACVPDPGGAPPGETGPQTTACKLTPAGSPVASTHSAASNRTAAPSARPRRSAAPSATSRRSAAANAASSRSAAPSATGASVTAPPPAPASPERQLLNYLLAP